MEKRVSGHSIAEYALILFLIVLVSIPALDFLGNAFKSAYEENEPISQAGRLFGLLDTGNGAAPAGDAAGSAAVQAHQPLSNIQFRFSKDGIVRFQKPDGSGTMTNSAEGTLIMASNLQRLTTNANLSQEERQQIANLSAIAFELAEAERLELEQHPTIEQGEFPDNGFFHKTGNQEPDVWSRYQKFGEAYSSLMENVEQYPELASIKSEIETNSAVISQTAYHNFIKPQLDYRRNKEVWEPVAEKKLVSGNVDVTQITRQNTPTVTSTFSQRLRKRRL